MGPNKAELAVENEDQKNSRTYMQAATAVCAELATSPGLPANYWRTWKAYGRRKARLLWNPASRL
jgi:hypothetical protein